MDFKELIKGTRTIRRFKQTEIHMDDLKDLVEFARYSPSGANKQPLKYHLVNDNEEMNKIFPLLKWAGALNDWDGPSLEERPSAYIIILLDKNILKSPNIDHGITAQSMMLGAKSKGLGCCIIGGFNKSELKKVLNMPEDLEPLLVLALGEPAENVIVDDYSEEAGLAYYRDELDNHHVPKRVVNDMLW